MKIRTGLVSNSSSSSFIIAWKGDIREELEKIFKLPRKFPIKINTNDIVKLFAYAIDDYSMGMSKKDIQNDFDEDLDEEPGATLVKWMNEGFNVAHGSFSDEGDQIEAFLCDSEIKYNSDTLKIQKEESY